MCMCDTVRAEDENEQSVTNGNNGTKLIQNDEHRISFDKGGRGMIMWWRW